MENHGKPSQKKKKQTNSRLGKLLEKIRGKEEPINNAIIKEKRVHIKWKRRDPIKQMDTTVSLRNGGGHQFLLCSEEDTIAPRRRLNYTFQMIKASMVKKYKTAQSIFSE